MKNNFNRRDFLMTAVAGTSLAGLTKAKAMGGGVQSVLAGKRVGIIGLDTSHSIAFVNSLNKENPAPEYMGYKVTAAYPYGSKEIESSYKRIPDYIEQVKKKGVVIVDSIKELLKQTDVILLETNDGRLHLEQALQVFKAGKRMFIDKPIAASLSDAVAIFEASEKYKLPIFSTSSLRYFKATEKLDRSKVLGADTYSPAHLEKSHPDFYWYGIHSVEALYGLMGVGCKSVVRVNTEGTDVIVGAWKDGRIGSVRGTRTGKSGYGGTVYTTDGNITLGDYGGYDTLLKEVIKYFETGVAPISPQETIEIFTFMEAADESKRRGGIPISLEETLKKASKK